MIKRNARYVKDERGVWWWRLANGGRTKAKLLRCEACGNEFPSLDDGQRCCSRKCSGVLRRTGRHRHRCVGCGNSFESEKKEQKFCSHSCAAISAQRNKKATTKGETDLVNANNPHFSLDDQGQWWYRVGKGGPTRAYVETCDECGRNFLASIYHRRRPGERPRCSRSCGIRAAVKRGRKVRSGHLHHAWRGGQRLDRNGYVLILMPNHPSLAGTKRRYVRAHRLVMEQQLGRLLLPNETVHHKNGIKTDNRPENLELWSHGHLGGQRVDERQHCPTCTCFKES